jgi:hypothetical protein
MTSFWSRYFPERSVAKIQKPTWVRVDATVSSPDLVTSPFSRVACAAARWWLMTERVQYGGSRAGNQVTHRIHASGWFGESLLLTTEEGPTILVPLAGASLTNSVDGHDVTVLTHVPPELAAYVKNLPADQGTACYRERHLASGDRVELRAVVEPLPKEGGYRDAPAGTAQLRACLEEGPVQIYDHLLG